MIASILLNLFVFGSDHNNNNIKINKHKVQNYKRCFKLNKWTLLSSLFPILFKHLNNKYIKKIYYTA